MTRLLAVPVSVLVLALAAAGCGGGNDNGGGGGGAASTPAKKKPATGGATAGKTAQVSMKNIAFNPKTITVAKGTTITWTNDDSVNHDVTKTGGAGPKFSSGTGNLAPGATYKQTFNTPGTISYVCTIHRPGMTGTIKVK